MQIVTPGSLTLTPIVPAATGAYPGILIPGVVVPSQPNQTLDPVTPGSLTLIPRS